ncbi:MAG: hypothetical protein LBT54_06895, partial [Bifidobacteriaceae bacterium]|nr:hypothetical protein [Bifidobacteriaceae bacterium]
MSGSGIGLEHADGAIRPQDDLYGHVNGGWLAGFEMPPDRAADGAFRELFDAAELHVREIVEAAAGRVTGTVEAAQPVGTADGDGSQAGLARAGESQADPEADLARIGALFASFMDTERVDSLGAGPAAADLALIDQAGSRAELARVIGLLERSGVGGLFQLWVDTDP